MNAAAVRGVGASLAATTLAQCEAVAQAALAAANPAAARVAVKEALSE
jgi:phosphotransferase system enzyme I (PtsI)